MESEARSAESAAEKVKMAAAHPEPEPVILLAAETKSAVTQKLNHSAENWYSNKVGRRRGLALVINMHTQIGGKGAAVDQGRLEALAHIAGFEVEVLEDYSAAEVCEQLQDLAELAALGEDDCFLCCVNAHGGTEGGAQYILDGDGEKIFLVRDILEPFKRSRYLLDKPKVFLINASRGDLKHRASRSFKASSTSSTGIATGITTGQQPVQTGENECLTYLQHPASTTPTGTPQLGGLTDWLLVFSTTENSESWRDRDTGSIFVKALMEAITRQYLNLDVLSILNLVNFEVTSVEIDDPASVTTLRRLSQAPVIISTLRKKLYWGPAKDFEHGMTVKQNLDPSAENCYSNQSVGQGRRRGLALVISMEANRDGGALDRGRFEALARIAGFDLEVWKDYSAVEVREGVQELVDAAPLGDDDCFLCCVNANGGTEGGAQYILDGDHEKIFVVRDILEPFKRSQYLLDKPKVFLLNACRGNSKHGASHSCEASSTSTSTASGLQPAQTIGGLTDWLLVFSTTENSVSWRDEEDTNPTFVKALMEAITREYLNLDVLSIMNLVNFEVTNSAALGRLSQAPVIISTLRKRLYWRP